MRAVICGFAATILLGGCVTNSQPYTPEISYRDSDFKAFSGAGPASLHGQAFLKTVGGDVKTCAGNKVFLMPANSYNQDIVAHLKGSTNINRDPASVSYNRTATCDAQGKFTFDNVPGGSWYVVTDVTWGVPQEYGIDQQGGMLLQKVTLRPGVLDAILTDSDRA